MNKIVLEILLILQVRRLCKYLLFDNIQCFFQMIIHQGCLLGTKLLKRLCHESRNLSCIHSPQNPVRLFPRYPLTPEVIRGAETARNETVPPAKHPYQPVHCP